MPRGPVQTFELSGAHHVPDTMQFSPDGCRCATASQNTAVIWDVEE